MRYTKDNGRLIYCKFLRFSLNQLTSRNMCFRCHRVSCGDNHEISGVSGHEYDNRRVEARKSSKIKSKTQGQSCVTPSLTENTSVLVDYGKEIEHYVHETYFRLRR